MIKYHDPKQLTEELVYFGLWSLEYSGHNVEGSYGNSWLGQAARGYNLLPYAENLENELVVGQGYNFSKPAPSDVFPPSRLCLLNVP